METMILGMLWLAASGGDWLQAGRIGTIVNTESRYAWQVSSEDLDLEIDPASVVPPGVEVVADGNDVVFTLNLPTAGLYKCTIIVVHEVKPWADWQGEPIRFERVTQVDIASVDRTLENFIDGPFGDVLAVPVDPNGSYNSTCQTLMRTVWSGGERCRRGRKYEVSCNE